MNFKNSFQIQATMIPNQFIDEYMTKANGEYVKEYLYLMRHEGEAVTISMMAEALNHTEADVTRALNYWKKAGVLSEEQPKKEDTRKASVEMANAEGADENKAEVREKRPSYTAEQINGLAGDEDFSQLLYIAQKYMNKVFTQRECEVFAYLYDGLHMPAELLEYVVEHCVQAGHTSIRYIETVAISWHERGIKTVDEAKTRAVSFSKDIYAVMRAFGLNDRNPGDSEREFINRWFGAYGFTRELVLEACNRTMTAIHAPSFPYTDKILDGWKKEGVRTMEDVKRLTSQYTDQGKSKTTAAQSQKAKGGTNQFQNFPQRDIDYDALVLKQLTEQ